MYSIAGVEVEVEAAPSVRNKVLPASSSPRRRFAPVPAAKLWRSGLGEAHVQEYAGLFLFLRSAARRGGRFFESRLQARWWFDGKLVVEASSVDPRRLRLALASGGSGRKGYGARPRPTGRLAFAHLLRSTSKLLCDLVSARVVPLPASGGRWRRGLLAPASSGGGGSGCFCTAKGQGPVRNFWFF